MDHSPKTSYWPEGYTAPEKPEYVRTFEGFVKFGHEEQVNKLLTEFKEAWTEKGISQSYSVYWNVFGKEGPCFAIRSVYQDIDAWSTDRKEVDEKMGEEKLMERWSQHMRHWQDTESFPAHDMTHIKEAAVTTNN